MCIRLESVVKAETKAAKVRLRLACRLGVPLPLQMLTTYALYRSGRGQGDLTPAKSREGREQDCSQGTHVPSSSRSRPEEAERVFLALYWIEIGLVQLAEAKLKHDNALRDQNAAERAIANAQERAFSLFCSFLSCPRGGSRLPLLISIHRTRPTESRSRQPKSLRRPDYGASD